jgi:hypothetical protein
MPIAKRWASVEEIYTLRLIEYDGFDVVVAYCVLCSDGCVMKKVHYGGYHVEIVAAAEETVAKNIQVALMGWIEATALYEDVSHFASNESGLR